MNIEGTREKKWVLLLFILCVVVRVYLYAVTFVIARDSTLFLAMAEAFRQGRFVEALQYITSPFYPIVVALGEAVVRDGETAGKLVSLLAGIGTFFPLYFLGKSIFEERTVCAGLFLYSIHPFLVRYSAEALSESTFIFLSVMGFWLLYRGWQNERWLYSVLAGGFLGLSCLTRPQGLLWMGVLVVLPIVGVVMRGVERGSKKAMVLSSILAIGIFLVVIFPYAWFLKGVTGEWTVRQGGAGGVTHGVAISPSGGMWNAIVLLLMKPWMLIKKVSWNLGQLAVLLPETIHYTFFFLLIIGVLQKRKKRMNAGEIYLMIVWVTYALGHCLLYLKVRYLLPVVPFTLFWAGEGVLLIVSWLEGALERVAAGLSRSAVNRLALWLVIGMVAVGTLPKTLQPQRWDKIDRKIVGLRIAALTDRPSVVLASDPRIGYYAGGKVVGFPRYIETLDDFLVYARSKNVEILVMNEKRIEDRKSIGTISRQWFSQTESSGLELLFVYPSDGEPKSTRFYVYRLLQDVTDRSGE